MRLHFLAGLLCILALQCRANPIVTITADHDSHSLEEKELETKGEIQEETTGVFKSGTSESSTSAVNEKESNSVEQQVNPVAIESNEVSTVSTEKKLEATQTETSTKVKPKKGKVSSKILRLKIKFTNSYLNVILVFD